MKIVANAHISKLTVEALREIGHDVTELLPRVEDPDVLDLARGIGAVVVTQDLDYSQLLAITREVAPSVISLRLRYPYPTYVTSILVRILNQYRSVIDKGAILSVDDMGEARVRLLPILD